MFYEFRVTGRNKVGYGQEAVFYWSSPEGKPTGPPTNLSYYFQTLDRVCVTWDMPLRNHTNGRIIRYDVQFHKKDDHTRMPEQNTTKTKAVFTNLEENTDYVFHVRAHTSQGAGPFSEKILIVTAKDIGRAPMSVQAVATSDSSVEVWWEPVPNRGKIAGYQIFYTVTAVEDLEEWKQKTVDLTESADLTNLEKFTTYAIAVAAKYKNDQLGKLSETVTVQTKPEEVPLNLQAPDPSTHSMTLSWTQPIRLNPINYKISFDAVKEFVDSQGMTQIQIVPRKTIVLPPMTLETTINDLQPFTTYNVNVSAVPQNGQYRPPARITVTTQMAAPKPMVKPDFYGVVNGEEIQVILPTASEEYGPISHYYLIVVPADGVWDRKNPDEFTESMINASNGKDDDNMPYIAAKFLLRDVPYTFHLGNDEMYEGYRNRKLQPNKKYRIFVRAVVDTPKRVSLLRLFVGF